MAKEILLYGSVNSETATDFVKEVEGSKDEDLVIRVNNSGGSPEDMFAMAAKISEHAKKKKGKVDGMAYSAGAFILSYMEDVECLDVSKFLIHRAAYPEWYEKSDYMTEAMWTNLNSINASLRAGLEAKIDVEKFNALGKGTLDEIFSNETRIDVFLNAKEAKKIGLVNKIVTLTPSKSAEIKNMVAKIAAEYNADPQIDIEFPETVVKEKKENKKTMTLDELKADHPNLYAKIYDSGVLAGIEKEHDRVKACMTFAEFDLPGVKVAIESKKDLSQAQMADFAMKQVSAALLKTTATESPAVVATTEVPATVTNEKNKAISDFENELKAELNIK